MLADQPLQERLARFFARCPDVQAAWLFGSHAAGRAHRESDVDVAILLDRCRHATAAARFEARVELAAQLVAELHDNRIDLVVLQDAPPLFARSVIHEGVLVHCSDPEAEHAFRRDAQLRAADIEPLVERGRRRLLEELRR